MLSIKATPEERAHYRKLLRGDLYSNTKEEIRDGFLSLDEKGKPNGYIFYHECYKELLVEFGRSRRHTVKPLLDAALASTKDVICVTLHCFGYDYRFYKSLGFIHLGFIPYRTHPQYRIYIMRYYPVKPSV